MPNSENYVSRKSNSYNQGGSKIWKNNIFMSINISAPKIKLLTCCHDGALEATYSYDFFIPKLLISYCLFMSFFSDAEK